MNWSQAVFVLEYLALFFEQKDDDILVGIFCCKMQGCVAIIVIGIGINFVLEEHLCHVQIAPKSSDVQSIPVELCDGIDVSLVLTEELDNVVMALVAGIVKRRPVIKTFVVGKGGVVILAIFEQMLGLVVLSFLAVLPEFVVVFGDEDPELIPVIIHLLDI